MHKCIYFTDDITLNCVVEDLLLYEMNEEHSINCMIASYCSYRACARDVINAAFIRNAWQKVLAFVWVMVMPRSCCAIGCTNRDTKEKREKGIKFHRIPVIKEKRNLWLSAIKKKDFDPKEYDCICSEHFVRGMKRL